MIRIAPLFAALALSIAPLPAQATDSPKDIVETAVAAGSFQTLVAAVKAAGLAGVLSGPGPFTVFAPTDAAFARLAPGTVEGLLKPEAKEQLVAILKHHVVAGRMPAAAVVEAGRLTSLEGQRLAITASSDEVTIAGSRIVKTDIGCRNGIIHVIDAVMMPERRNIVEVATGAGSFKTLLAAATAAGLVPTLATGGPFTVFAPTDEAFAALPDGTVASLLRPENQEKLAGILKHHVVSGTIYSDQALRAGRATTLQGTTLEFGEDEGGAAVSGARLSTVDVVARNGVIHVIDRVLLPK